MTIRKSSFLYRGIDYPPKDLKNPLRLNNGEKILWTTQDSASAQTYIPDWGGSAGITIGYDLTESPRPDEGIISSLMEACGGPVVIHSREWKIADHPKVNPNVVTNGTFGRPWSWSQNPRATWEDIVKHLQSLGYNPQPSKFLWVKTKTELKDGGISWTAAPKNSRLTGSLVIFQTTDDLVGADLSDGEGNLMDPDYHKAAGWAEKTQKDFLRIDDFCQTTNHGNVGHRAIAVLEPGLAKLKIAAILPAFHHEWPENGHPNMDPTPEASKWEKHYPKKFSVGLELEAA